MPLMNVWPVKNHQLNNNNQNNNLLLEQTDAYMPTKIAAGFCVNINLFLLLITVQINKLTKKMIMQEMSTGLSAVLSSRAGLPLEQIVWSVNGGGVRAHHKQCDTVFIFISEHEPG